MKKESLITITTDINELLEVFKRTQVAENEGYKFQAWNNKIGGKDVFAKETISLTLRKKQEG